MNEYIKNEFDFLLNLNFFGFSFLEIFFLFIIFSISLIFRTFFSKIIIKKLKYFVNKTSNRIDDNFLNVLEGPLKIIPIYIAFVILLTRIDIDSSLGDFIQKINRSLLTVIIFLSLYKLILPISNRIKDLKKYFSIALMRWIINAFKYLIIFLGSAAILEIWGIKVGPIIAGLGLLGVAVALGAQDLFKNLISGILILMENRFEIGDVIKVQGYTEGTVNQMGFRSTTIIQFDSTPITIPNYLFAEVPIINFSKREYRRINWTLGFEYSSSIEKLKEFNKKTIDYINSSENFIINDSYKCRVYISKFSDSSIDILIYCFTNTKDWDTFLNIKQDLSYFLKKTAADVGINFAFPSQSIYIEKND